MSSPQLSVQAIADKPWAELSWQEKRERRFQNWLSAPGITFSSPEAQAAYRARVTRLSNVCVWNSRIECLAF